MSERSAWMLGVVAAIVATVLVWALDAPVGHLDRSLALVLSDGRGEPLLFTDPPAGFPDWLLTIDRAVSAALLLTILFGALPLGLLAVVLNRMTRLHGRHGGWLARALPYLLIAQVSSLVGPVLITLLGLVEGGLEYAREPFAWYFALPAILGVLAIPIWRQLLRRIQSRPVGLDLAQRPA